MNTDYMNINLIITKNGKGKQAAAAVMFMMISLSCAGISTGENSGASGAAKWVNCEAADFTEGWCDENTYRIRIKASPSIKSRTVKERLSISKKAAILTAREKILERFKELGIDVNYTAFDPAAYTIAHEVRKSIKNGKIISEKWDEDQNCEIIYEVYSKRLKRKVENSAFE